MFCSSKSFWVVTTLCFFIVSFNIWGTHFWEITLNYKHYHGSPEDIHRVLQFLSAVMTASACLTISSFTATAGQSKISSAFSLELPLTLLCLHQVQPFHKHSLSSCECLHFLFPKTKLLIVYWGSRHIKRRLLVGKEKFRSKI